jgi:hypothetical protein
MQPGIVQMPPRQSPSAQSLTTEQAWLSWH